MLQINDIQLEVNGYTLLTKNHLQADTIKTIGVIGRNGSGKSTLLNYINDNKTVITDEDIKFIPQIKDSGIELSGGENTKSYMQDALKSHAGLMLLDEPTTHLDETNAKWLLNQLDRIRALKIIASHDRDFLDKIADEIWSIEDGTIKVYPGNYSKYKEIKSYDLKRQQEEYDKYIKEKKHLENAIYKKKKQARNATKVKNKNDSEVNVMGAKPYFNKRQKKLDQVASSMKSRLNQLEKKEKPFEDKAIHFHTQNIEPLGRKIIFHLDHRNIEINGIPLIEDVNLFIKSTGKVAVTGANGSGKTTLLNHLYKEYESSNLDIGYFYQQLESLNNEQSIIENIMSTSKYDQTTVRTVLARLNIRRDDVHKEVSVISGGEQVKVQLVKILMSDHQVLFLDEPTNFLDVHTIEALEDMLRSYPGTIILVSHDKMFRDNITDKTYNIQSKRLVEDLAVTSRSDTEDQLMVIDNKITEVLGRMSVEPNPELDEEFHLLLREKWVLEEKD